MLFSHGKTNKCFLFVVLFPFKLTSHRPNSSIKPECIPVGRVPPACYRTDPPGHVTCGGIWDRDIPPPVNRFTDTCKKITFPQLRCGRLCSPDENITSLPGGIQTKQPAFYQISIIMGLSTPGSQSSS